METMFLQSIRQYHMTQSPNARGCHSTHTSMRFSSQMEGAATKRALLGSWCGAMLLVCIDFGLCMGRALSQKCTIASEILNRNGRFWLRCVAGHVFESFGTDGSPFSMGVRTGQQKMITMKADLQKILWRRWPSRALQIVSRCALTA